MSLQQSAPAVTWKFALRAKRGGGKVDNALPVGFQARLEAAAACVDDGDGAKQHLVLI